MTEAKIVTEKRGHVLLIGFNRADKYNGFDLEMFMQLADAYGQLEADPELRVGLVYAKGKHFTAGLDLPQWGDAFSSGRWLDYAAHQRDPVGLDPQQRVSKPLVMAIQGICFTIGIEIALAGDIRVCADDARFGQIEVKRGIYAVCGATVRMVQEFGWANAQRYLLTGDEFNAAEAHRIGLVQEVAPAGYHGLFDTHPDNDTRLRQVVAAATPLATGQGEVGRETYLRMIAGMPFGDSAEAGVRRGQRFYHVGLDFTLGLPQDWELINRPDALILHSPDQQAFMVMSMQGLKDATSAQDFIRQRTGGRGLSGEQSFRQHGLDVTTGVLPGNGAKRVAVVMRGRDAFQFVGAVKGRASLESADDRFMDIVRSFRPLQADERRLGEPRRLALVQFQRGQSLEELSRQMEGEGDRLKRLRLLNGLYPTGQPLPGDWLKVVR